MRQNDSDGQHANMRLMSIYTGERVTELLASKWYEPMRWLHNHHTK